MGELNTIKRLFDIPAYQLNTYNLDNAFSTKDNGVWKSISSEQFVNQANAISRGLLRLGVMPNDKIALISSTNRMEWNICDIGILQTGAQNVPVYPTISKEDYQFVLNHSEAKYCFVSDASVLEKLNQIKGNTQLKAIFTFDQITNEQNWNEVLELGEDKSNQEKVDQIKKGITTDDIATLIYTSGTTGKPKGVMLSHENLISNVLATSKKLPLDNGKDGALSFLPLCHVFERMIIYLYQYSGITVHYAESIDKLMENVQEVQPQIMTAVPRLYEKIYDKILAKGTDLTGIKKKLFFWAIDLGLKYEPYAKQKPLYALKIKIARKLIFSKWQQAIGGNIKLMISGGAALQTRLTRIFAAAGMPIVEGYGLTETSPVISFNEPKSGEYKVGTIGKVIELVNVKIATDGEILVKGPNVMQGYYKDPEKTAEVMTDGYFHTGDIGEVSADGFLRITDRKKEIFKTSGGKYIAPTPIENQLKQSQFIEQAMVIGEGEKMPAAIIQPNFEYLKQWALHHNITFQSNQELITNKIVIQRLEKEIAFHNKNFGKWEQIKKFELTADEWSTQGGQLTPKMSMKRKAIKEIYIELYDRIYCKAE